MNELIEQILNNILTRLLQGDITGLPPIEDEEDGNAIQQLIRNLSGPGPVRQGPTRNLSGPGAINRGPSRPIGGGGLRSISTPLGGGSGREGALQEELMALNRELSALGSRGSSGSLASIISKLS